MDIPLTGGHSLNNMSWKTGAPDPTTAITNASAVPEPSTYALFALGFGGLALWKRRQRKRKGANAVRRNRNAVRHNRRAQ